MTIERATGKRINDLLNFGSNRIPPDKIGIFKDGAEKAFGQKMLNKHFLNDIRTDLWVKRLTTKLGKGIESSDEFLIVLVFPLNDCQQCSCEFRDTLLKLLYRTFKGCDIWLSVGEKLTKEITHLVRVMQVELKGSFFVLKKDGSLRVLENGIGERIASRDLSGNLFIQIALWPLGLPKAAFEVETIA